MYIINVSKTNIAIKVLRKLHNILFRSIKYINFFNFYDNLNKSFLLNNNNLLRFIMYYYF